MKRITLILSLVLLVLALAAPVGADFDKPLGGGGSWTASTALPTTTEGPGMARFDAEYYNGKIYVLGFRMPAGTPDTDGSVWAYDVTAMTWADTGVDMPTPVSNYSIAKLTDASGTGLYLFGGRDVNGLCTTAVQAYYPDTNTTASFGSDAWAGQVAGALIFPGGVEVSGNKAYAWGGFCGGTPSPYVGSETWIFDPIAVAGARWTAGPALPSGGGYQTAAEVDNMIYSIGGDSYDGSALTAYDTVLALDPANLGAGWVTKAVIPIPSSGVPGCDQSRALGFDTGSAWQFEGHLVLAGCGQWDQSPTTLPDSFIYDVASNTWATFPALITARRNHAGAFVPVSAGAGYLWVGGGYDTSGTNTMTDTSEIYNIGGAPTSVTLTAIEGRTTGGAGAWLAPLGLVAAAGLALALGLRRK